MAKMIPNVMAATTPLSERRIFERLQRDPDTSDWIVLHSLGLSRTRVGPHGEIDFVVLAPGLGVVCIEVKGGEVSCINGRWSTKNTKTGEISFLSRSPYLQARENMYELKKKVEAHFGNDHPISKTVFSYAVVFPMVRSLPDSPEVEQWETFDSESLRNPLAKLIRSNLVGTKSKLNRGVPAASLSADTLNGLRNFLRPDFERTVVRAATIAQSEEELISLTEEQYAYLDDLISC